MSRLLPALLTVCFLLPSGCTSDGDESPPTLNAIREMSDLENAKTSSAAAQSPAASNVDVEATGTFQVEFITTIGRFVVDVHREWAPVGAERFHQLVEDQFYDDCAFFRVVPNFMAQFGLPADPGDNAKWDSPISDDPVTQPNRRGTVTFATSGPNSRTTQLFINFKDNSASLDPQGFSPFGKVIEGMDVVDRINAKHGETPNQGSIKQRGNAYLNQFPDLTYIQTARIVETP